MDTSSPCTTVDTSPWFPGRTSSPSVMPYQFSTLFAPSCSMQERRKSGDSTAPPTITWVRPRRCAWPALAAMRAWIIVGMMTVLSKAWISITTLLHDRGWWRIWQLQEMREEHAPSRDYALSKWRVNSAQFLALCGDTEPEERGSSRLTWVTFSRWSVSNMAFASNPGPG